MMSQIGIRKKIQEKNGKKINITPMISGENPISIGKKGVKLHLLEKFKFPAKWPCMVKL